MKIFHSPLFLLLFLTACGGGGGGSEGNGNSGNSGITQALNFPLETITVSANDEPIATQVATSGQSTLAISYTSSNPAVAMVDAQTGVVTIIGAGETTITATGEADAQATKASYVLTVAQPASAFSFPLEMFEVNFADPPIATQIATGGQSTGAITYSSGDTAVATVDAMTGVVTMTGSGSLIITATRAGDARYEAIKASYRLTVARATDTLNFPLETMMVLAIEEPIATQVATSEASARAISYRSSNLAVATVDAMTGIVTLVGAGETIIIATRAGDAQYEAAEASYRLTVARATDTLNFPLKAMMVLAIDEPITSQIATGGQSTRTIVYTSGNRAVATVDEVTGVVTLVGAGITTITATRVSDAQYEPTTATYILTVARATDTLAFPLETMMASADAEPITTQIASGGQGGGAISYRSGNRAVATVDEMTGVVTLVGAGTIKITATRARDARYAAAEASYTLTVARVTDTLVFPLETMMASADAEPITTQIATSDSGTEGISYMSSNIAVATVDEMTGVVIIVGAGETTITATRARGARYEFATATYILTIERAIGKLSFPSDALFASADHEPIRTQVVTGGQNTGTIVYTSDDVAIARVNAETGVATIVGAGTATITVTRAINARYEAAEASYKLTVVPTIDTLSFLTTKLNVPTDHGPITTQTATGGLSTGAITYLSSNVAIATVDTSTGVVTIVGEGTVIITATQAMDASHKTATAHYSLIVGTILNTRGSGRGKRVCTTNTYASGLIEEICEIVGLEYFLLRDCDGDGLRQTRVLIRAVSRKSGSSRQEFCVPTNKLYPDLPPPESEELAMRLQEAISFSPAYTEDPEYFDGKITNAPRRISLPEDIPDFLRFSGAIENIVIHISPTSLGPLYVKIDSNDPSVQLLVQKIDTRYGGRVVTDLRHDYFAGAPLIEYETTTSYAIYAVKGDLYQTVFDQHPNFYVRYDSINMFTHSLLRKALDDTRNIVVNADIPEFLDYYDKVRVQYSPYQYPSIYSGVIFMSPRQIYAPELLIHEVAHGYHNNVLPNGFSNQEIRDLYARLPSSSSVRYWRTNYLEFFAQATTVWVYLESGLDFNGRGPDALVDSTFYYAHLKPWFDNHFNKED